MTRPFTGLSERAVPKSRTDRLLNRLLAANTDEWIPAPELAEIGGLLVNARLWEIRHKLKFDGLENKVEIINGEEHSFYRLRRGTVVSVPEKHLEAPTDTLPVSSSLFGDLRPDRSYWE